MESVIDEKIDQYMKVGVPHVWSVDLHDRTITVCRPGAMPECVNVLGTLTAGPELPGLQIELQRLVR